MTNNNYYDQNPEVLNQYQNQPSMWQTGLRNGLYAITVGFRVAYRIVWDFFWRWWR